eukprot:TRINITY_DN18135_c0_g1_i2.p1 TRINITY_DN18135_c0_g1~~TRINITY_DN18135_c0_g1_i2.p1  ORF type:complete len:783 (+),score=136.05 TRINITY_DN18135_c0_g1_i2:62-2350(+)
MQRARRSVDRLKRSVHLFLSPTADDTHFGLDSGRWSYVLYHPYLRILIAFLLPTCNFLLYGEDPIVHSYLEADVPVFGHAVSLIFRRYPPQGWARFMKVIFWLLGLPAGLALGRLLVHHMILRDACGIPCFGWKYIDDDDLQAARWYNPLNRNTPYNAEWWGGVPSIPQQYRSDPRLAEVFRHGAYYARGRGVFQSVIEVATKGIVSAGEEPSQPGYMLIEPEAADWSREEYQAAEETALEVLCPALFHPRKHREHSKGTVLVTGLFACLFLALVAEFYNRIVVDAAFPDGESRQRRADYVINGGLGWSENSFGKFAAVFTWLADLLNLVACSDTVLQELRRHQKKVWPPREVVQEGQVEVPEGEAPPEQQTAAAAANAKAEEWPGSEEVNEALLHWRMLRPGRARALWLREGSRTAKPTGDDPAAANVVAAGMLSGRLFDDDGGGGPMPRLKMGLQGTHAPERCASRPRRAHAPAMVFFGVVGNGIDWDDWQRETSGTGSTELFRCWLAGLIAFLGPLTVIQDWEWPSFDGVEDVRLPGLPNTECSCTCGACHVDTTKWKRFRQKDRDGNSLEPRAGGLPCMACYITNRWFTFVPFAISLVLDFMMLRDSYAYAPGKYGQYTNPLDDAICSTRNTSFANEIKDSWEQKGVNIANYTVRLRGGYLARNGTDFCLPARYTGVSPALKLLVCLPGFLVYLWFFLALLRYARLDAVARHRDDLLARGGDLGDPESDEAHTQAVHPSAEQEQPPLPNQVLSPAGQR